MDPDLEGRDIMAVIDHLASLDWVLKEDGPDGTDPVLGGLGGSYGGGFQWVGAFSDQYFRGAPTRFDALAPGNTWYDLRTALAPNDVMRTVMVTGLYAAGAASNRLAPWLHVAMGAFVASGQVVDGPAPADFAAEIHQHSAAWFVERGERLDIPVFVQQGAGDLVFNLNEGLDAFHEALTPEAWERSLFANHQAGHFINRDELPGGPVPYAARTEDICPAPSPLAWFEHTLLGRPLDLGPRYRMRTVGGRCVGLDELPEREAVAAPALDQAVLPTGVRTEPRFEAIAQGPLTIAGAPLLRFNATTADPDARLFWGLAVGTSPADAQLIGAQWMPTRIAGPALGAAIETELGGAVVDIEEGETLYLVASPYSDQFLAHGSRHPGVVLVEGVSIGLPIVTPTADITVEAPAAGRYSDAVPVGATLTLGNEPLAATEITFSLGDVSVTATTGDDGRATALLPLSDVPGSYTLSAAFAGNDDAAGASASQPFTIERELTEVTGWSPARPRGETVELSAALGEDDGPALAGKTIVFRVRDLIFTATTDATGTARVTAVVPDHGRSADVSVSFEGDELFEGSSDSFAIRWGKG
jgi:hypothetical protein